MHHGGIPSINQLQRVLVKHGHQSPDFANPFNEDWLAVIIAQVEDREI